MKFNPAFQRLQEEIAAGTIGKPRNLRAGFSIPWPNEGGSRWQPPGGGALLDQGIYPVTLAHSIFGVPELIVARGTAQQGGVDLAEQVTLEFGDGRFAHFTTGMLEFTDCSAAVGGMTGWITLPAPFWATTDLDIHAGSIEAIFGNPDRVSIQREGHGYVPMLREVVGAISRGLLEHPQHSAADTLSVFRTLDAISDQLKY
ncbi:Gfo/Idh/MocA family protein [Streptomyces sp. GTA36]